jgi:two-component system, NarL family, response regulator YdfI
MIRVGLLSPSLAVRVGLRALLETDTQIAVIAEAGSLDEFLGSSTFVDILIMTGESLVDLDGETVAFDEIPETAVLILGDATAVLRSLPQYELPAWGVLSQEASQEELLAALHALGQGLIVGEPSMLVSLMGPALLANERLLDGSLETLTERELEVLQLLAQGLANKQIAGRLGISAHTVKFHISSIYGKLGATNRTEAVRIGLKIGLILL